MASLNQLQACNVSHVDSIQYACLSTRKSFCKKCYAEHRQKCVSSRCGDAKKLTFTILQRVEYYKLKTKLLNANVTNGEFTSLKDSLGSMYLQWVKILQEYISKKVPYLVLAMQNQLIDNAIRAAGVVTEKSISSSASSTSNANPLNHSNLNDLYSGLTKISRKENLEKADLDYVIVELNKITVSDSNLSETAKKRSTAATSTLGAELGELCKKIRSELEYATNVRDEFDRVIQSKLKEVVWRVSLKNTNLAYNSIENLKMEEFPNLSSISDLQSNPTQLLDVAKHILKRGIFSHSSYIRFPYRYCYLMNTCPQQDQTFEKMVVGMERKLINTIMSISEGTTVNKNFNQLTKKILIMGPELIEIDLSNLPQNRMFNCKIKVWGYIDGRQRVYESIPQWLGLKNDKCIDSLEKITTQQSSNSVDNVYYVIGMAHQILYKDVVTKDANSVIKAGRQMIDKMIKDGELHIPLFDSLKKQAVMKANDQMI